jgi:hypothetical protein
MWTGGSGIFKASKIATGRRKIAVKVNKNGNGYRRQKKASDGIALLWRAKEKRNPEVQSSNVIVRRFYEI